MKLLIADDEKAVCAIFRHHIMQYPSPYIEYRIANDGQELLSGAAKWQPDIIITDIKMPNMSGLEAVQELRDMSPASDVRIYVISGYTDFALVRQALRLGVADYIPKPVKYIQLESLLRKEEERRYTGLTPESAYALGDENLALSLSGTIQLLADSYASRDRDAFSDAVQKCTALMTEHGTEISPDFFMKKFSSDARGPKEQADVLASLTGSSAFSYGSPGLVEQMTARVKRNYSDASFGLDQIAAELGYSTQYLSTLFKKEKGSNFSSYVTGIRMEHAKKLLTETDMKIKDIASACGYNYTNYFIKVFNRAEGIAPAEWKRSLGI